ncbi:MAG TPA: hypothetical protein VEV13_04685 [Candidatus Limnocylindria bacterium]|nr:hypothetical protein [Candidatus Limnocylindria bacterium]
MNRRERKAAVRAWRKLPTDTRAETVRLARQGHSHPDDGVARVAETWAESAVGGAWWAQVWGWPLVVLGLLILGLAGAVASLFVLLAGIVVIIAGFLGQNQRHVARRILTATHPR